MLAALLIVFREVFEAGLIVGIVMAVTAGVSGRAAWIVAGVAAGVFGACLVAVFTGALSQLFGGSGQEVFNAVILAFAVVMLTWHNVWMARHGREMAAELQAAGAAVAAGSKSLVALAVVVAIAVLREGSEVVLFLYGVAAAQGGASWAMVAGGFAGLVLGSIICLLTYLGLVTIPARYLFGVTSTLIAFLAAGLAAQAIAFLQQADIITALDQTVWDTSWLLRDFKLSGPGLAHPDRLCRSAHRHAAHRLRGYARGDCRADEIVFRSGAQPGPAQSCLRGLQRRTQHERRAEPLSRDRPAGKMVWTSGRHRDFAKVCKFGFQAFDIEPNGGASRERQGDHPGGRILLGKRDCEQVEPAIFIILVHAAAFAGEHPFETQRRPATAIIALPVQPGIDSRQPIKPVKHHDEAVLARLPKNITGSHQRVLHMC